MSNQDNLSLLTDRIFGMPAADLLEVRKKLTILGISTNELLSFLDRDKVQLFAEQQSKIKMLELKLKKISDVVIEETGCDI